MQSLERLQAVITPSCPQVEVRLDFSFEEGTPLVTGRVSLMAELRCQRCLEMMPVTIAAEVRLAVVRPGGSAPADSACEILEVEDGPISLPELVEDELLLALPDYPMHRPPCRGSVTAPADDAEAEERAPSPFAVLANWTRG